MVATGKKFIIALVVLAVLLGIGWWLLQRPPAQPLHKEPATSTAPPGLIAPQALSIDPSEPKPDPRLLREVAVSLRLIADSLSGGNNPQAAVAMLQLLEQRVAVSASPSQLMSLRSALESDRKRLQDSAAPSNVEMRATLERLRTELDSLPNIFVPGTGPSSARTTEASGGQQTVDQTYLGRLMRAFEERIADVVKIRRVEDRRASFRTPEQGRILTEQLRFRLELAGLSLETRNQAVFGREMAGALAILSQGFDADDPAVIAFRSALVQMQGQSVHLSMPQPEASMRALELLTAGAAQ